MKWLLITKRVWFSEALKIDGITEGQTKQDSEISQDIENRNSWR